MAHELIVAAASSGAALAFKGVTGGSWELNANMDTDAPTLVELDANEIGVTFRDNAGTLITSNRPPFQLAVFS